MKYVIFYCSLVCCKYNRFLANTFYVKLIRKEKCLLILNRNIGTLRYILQQNYVREMCTFFRISPYVRHSWTSSVSISRKCLNRKSVWKGSTHFSFHPDNFPVTLSSGKMCMHCVRAMQLFLFSFRHSIGRAHGLDYESLSRTRLDWIARSCATDKKIISPV